MAVYEIGCFYDLFTVVEEQFWRIENFIKGKDPISKMFSQEKEIRFWSRYIHFRLPKVWEVKKFDMFLLFPKQPTQHCPQP